MQTNISNQMLQETKPPTRANIKVILGEYISQCTGSKYDILEAFMKGAVFDNKTLRDSYLEEVMQAAEDSAYRIALQQYMLANRMGFSSTASEQTHFMEWV